jgi:7,8-dihydropterin-6-yl-methyl-4-(beta-D-ribofuranosyl)aminobenzene 5'-phosphate synthase
MLRGDRRLEINDHPLEPSMSITATLRTACLCAALALTVSPAWSEPTDKPAETSPARVTIFYDAFGKDSSLQKDWGFSALVEIGGKRILFDTGNNAEVFAANAKAKGVDFATLDFVVQSHRHADHLAGLSEVLKVNPKVNTARRKASASTARRSRRASIARTSNSPPSSATMVASRPRS